MTVRDSSQYRVQRTGPTATRDSQRTRFRKGYDGRVDDSRISPSERNVALEVEQLRSKLRLEDSRSPRGGLPLALP